MDGSHFDDFARSLGSYASRRVALVQLAATGLITPLLGLSLQDAAAKKKHKKKKKVKRNEFGCVDVGKFCKNGGQCCSGICEGKKDKKKCKAHDQSTCQVGQTFVECGGSDVECMSTSGDEGTCVTTTGNGAYCAADPGCFPCKTDADCVAVCGPQAACFPCAENCPDEGTACSGVSVDSCDSP